MGNVISDQGPASQDLFVKNTRVSIAEISVPLAVTISLLIASIIVSGKSCFWMDELLTYNLVTDTSFSHMLHALGDQVDTTPPLYYVVCWFWTRGFGASELSLRLFSSLCISGALWITWTVLRRHVSLWAASFGIVSVFCLSPLVYYQNAEARFYGLFLLLSALALASYDNLTSGKQLKRSDLILNLFVHAAIILVHVYGFIYSTTILLCCILDDLMDGRCRLRVYASFVLGWVAFLPWLGPFLHQSEVGKPHSWITVPGLPNLLRSFDHRVPIGMLIGVLIVLALVSRVKTRKEHLFKATTSLSQVRALLLLGVSFTLFVPMVGFFISRVGTSIFLDRYMFPSTLGIAIIMSVLGELLVDNEAPSSANSIKDYVQAVALWSVIAMFTVAPVCDAIGRSQRTLQAELFITAGYADLPIVAQSPHTYLPQNHYQRNRKWYMVLDWDAALAPCNALNSTVDYKLMAALKRNYPFHNIITTEDFLGKYKKFLVRSEPGRCWFELRLASNPNYNTKCLGEGLFLVERK